MKKNEETLKCFICENDSKSSTKIEFYGNINDIQLKNNLENHFEIKIHLNENLCKICHQKMENRSFKTKCIDCEVEETTNIDNRCNSCSENNFIKKIISNLSLCCPICKTLFDDFQKIQKHLKIEHKKKEITLDDWKSMKTKNLQFVEKKNYSEITTKIIEEFLFEKMYPLVFSNSLDILKSNSPSFCIFIFFTFSNNETELILSFIILLKL